MTDAVKFAPAALTFDDVLLLPAHSAIMPGEADTTARLSRRITLSIPLVSSEIVAARVSGAAANAAEPAASDAAFTAPLS